VTDDEARAGRGTFITLEGPDGSGKSSLLPAIAAVLREAGVGVVATREPGGTRLGERVREILLETGSGLGHTGRADALLFAAARAQHVAEVIAPALARGATVICDRFADSSMAYQGAGSQLPLDEVAALQRFATAGLVPDLTILLDLPVEEGLRRKAGEVTRFEESFDVAYHQRVRDAFLRLAAAAPERFVVVDATRGPDAVLAAAVAALGRVPALAPLVARARTGAVEGERP
jgi:dTMP kinase